MSRPIVIGNWKMHGDGSSLDALDAVADKASSPDAPTIALCVPAMLIHRAVSRFPGLPIGGQDCDYRTAGAFTGSVSAAMLRDAGASLVILGHSERREAGDDSATVAAKVSAATAAGLRVILCVGEDMAAREAGDAVSATCRQLAESLPPRPQPDLIVAYEPIWAIGRGCLPTLAEIGPVVSGLRQLLCDAAMPATPVLYGGSVTAASVPDLMADDVVDGLLIGKASLDPTSLGEIMDAAGRAAATPGP